MTAHGSRVRRKHGGVRHGVRKHGGLRHGRRVFRVETRRGLGPGARQGRSRRTNGETAQIRRGALRGHADPGRRRPGVDLQHHREHQVGPRRHPLQAGDDGRHRLPGPARRDAHRLPLLRQPPTAARGGRRARRRPRGGALRPGGQGRQALAAPGRLRHPAIRGREVPHGRLHGDRARAARGGRRTAGPRPGAGGRAAAGVRGVDRGRTGPRAP